MESNDCRIMRIMRQNEELRKRHQEVERDRIEAELRNASVTLKKVSTKLSDMTPAERDAYRLSQRNNAVGRSEIKVTVEVDGRQKRNGGTERQTNRSSENNYQNKRTNNQNHENMSNSRNNYRGHNRGAPQRIQPKEITSNGYGALSDEEELFTDIASLDPNLPVDPSFPIEAGTSGWAPSDFSNGGLPHFAATNYDEPLAESCSPGVYDPYAKNDVLHEPNAHFAFSTLHDSSSSPYYFSDEESVAASCYSEDCLEASPPMHNSALPSNIYSASTQRELSMPQETSTWMQPTSAPFQHAIAAVSSQNKSKLQDFSYVAPEDIATPQSFLTRGLNNYQHPQERYVCATPQGPEPGTSLRSSVTEQSSPKEAEQPPSGSCNTSQFLKLIDFTKPPPTISRSNRSSEASDQQHQQQKNRSTEESISDGASFSDYDDHSNYPTVNQVVQALSSVTTESDAGYVSQCLDNSSKNEGFLVDEFRDMWPNTNNSSTRDNVAHIPPVMSSTPYAPFRMSAANEASEEVVGLPRYRPILGRGASEKKLTNTHGETTSECLDSLQISQRPSFDKHYKQPDSESSHVYNVKPSKDNENVSESLHILRRPKGSKSNDTGSSSTCNKPAKKKTALQERMERARNDSSRRFARGNMLQSGGVVEASYGGNPGCNAIVLKALGIGDERQSPPELANDKNEYDSSQMPNFIAQNNSPFLCEDVREKDRRSTSHDSDNWDAGSEYSEVA